jgi:hypothetical protein
LTNPQARETLEERNGDSIADGVICVEKGATLPAGWRLD